MSAYCDLIARNLKRFRSELQLQPSELAKKSGVSVSVIEQYENASVDNPSTATITELASALNRTIFDFFRAPKTLKAVRFQADASLNKEARESIVDSCAIWLDRYCFLEDLLDDKICYNLPDPLEDGPVVDVPKYAAKVRKYLGFSPSEPIANVTDALNRSGVKFWICKREETDKVFGLSFAESPQRTGVVVFDNEKITAERRIFTAIYELGHLALHSQSFNKDDVEEDKEEERQADLFAEHFLMPNEEFERRWNDSVGRPFVERVLFVKRFFRVSYRTVLHRLIEIGKKDKNIYRNFPLLCQQYDPEGIKNCREPLGLDKIDVSDDRFRRMVYRAVEDEEITISKAAELLGTTVSQIYNVFNSTDSCE